MNLLSNGFVQLLVISLLTSPSLSCAPATSPCTFTNTAPMGFTGLGPCDSASSATNNHLVSSDTCTVPNGGNFELSAGACDTGILAGRPIILNGQERNGTQDLTFSCNGDNILRATAGNSEVMADVNRIDCYSSLLASNCDFFLDDEIDPTIFNGNAVQCGGDVIPDCALTDSQQILIPDTVCALNGLNRPLCFNAQNDFPATPNNVLVGDTTLTCSNTGLAATNPTAGIFNVDINRIECSFDCVLNLNGNAANNAVAVGSCEDNTPPTGTCIIDNPTTGLLLTQSDICAAEGNIVEVVIAGTTVPITPALGVAAGDTFTFECNAGLTGLATLAYFDSAGVNTLSFNNVEQIICRA